MVRRWSCINSFNLNIPPLKNFEKKFGINLFLSVVSLKKFFFRFTKFKRKSLSRKKHKTTWLIYVNIFSLWIKDYSFIKKYTKIQFFYNIFFYNIFFYNTNLIKNNPNNKFINNFNFVYLFFNRKVLTYFDLSLNIFKNVNILYSFNRALPVNSDMLVPVSLQFDKEIFFTKTLNLDFIFSDEFIFNLVLKKLKEIYKILTILNYYKITLKSFNVK